MPKLISGRQELERLDTIMKMRIWFHYDDYILLRRLEKKVSRILGSQTSMTGILRALVRNASGKNIGLMREALMASMEEGDDIIEPRIDTKLIKSNREANFSNQEKSNEGEE